jgi:argininosuccinate synthase
MAETVRKVVLAYSGGLDTSVILCWLKETHRCEVVTFTADLGQGEELEPARRKAELLGASQIFVDDLREEFVRDFVFPMFRANALYEGAYLLGTSIARPLIAKRQIEIAREVGADAVAHGATGKGNDQVRFELGYYALAPDIKVIAPWREWDLTSRTRLLDYADRHQIPIARDKRGEAPFSVDANLLHISAEGKVLEDPWTEPEEFVFSRTIAPEAAPEVPEYVEIEFARGDAVAINGERLSPAALLTRLNERGGRHGIGRLDLVENRFVGMKSRGVYETPGGTILLAAHRGIESLTLDRGAAHLKDELMPRYAELIYNGFWFSPERAMLQALIDKSQENVDGIVRLKLYKGSVRVVGRKSPKSLYSQAHVTFEEDAVYDQRDAEGFIKLNALRLRLAARRNAEPAPHPSPLPASGEREGPA